MDYTKESFENWLKEIPVKLKTVTDNFAKQHRLTLNYSLASLDVLEKWMLEEYEVATDLKEEEELLDMLALYVGETYIKHIGGEWFVDLENDKNAYYMKLVMKYEEDGEMYCRSAKSLCTSSISRRRGTLLSSTLKKSIVKKDESDN